MISRIKVRSDFVAASKAPWQARPAVVVQARFRGNSDGIRAGFTATRKIGNAVARNRAKRRLREAAEQMLPLYGLPGHDYVFVARASTGSCAWQALLDDVKAALIRLARPRKPATDTPSRPSVSLSDSAQD